MTPLLLVSMGIKTFINKIRTVEWQSPTQQMVSQTLQSYAEEMQFRDERFGRLF